MRERVSAAMAAVVMMVAPAQAEVSPLQSLRELDMATARIGYRIATANTALCERQQPASGLLLHGLEQYGGGDAEAARRLFALGVSPGVLGVVPGSPADRAGVKANDALIAVNGVAPEEPRMGGKPFDRMAAVLDAVETAFARGPVTLTLSRNGQTVTAQVTGAPACASRFQVDVSKTLNAAADGQYVQVSAGFIASFANEDEFAAIVAHELAHNILGHRARLDAQGVSRGMLGQFGKNAARIRETEIEADRLSIRLLANAGYRPEAAAEFWRRFGPRHDAGIFSASTHLRWRKRAALLEEEVAALRGGAATLSKRPT